MLINLGEQLKKYNIQPKGIIHVGAHWAEEHNDYLSYGIKDFVYIEPCKQAFDILQLKFRYPSEYSVDLNNHVAIFNVACGAKEGTMTMFASENNQGQSNSLLEPNLHLQQHPEVIFNTKEEVAVVRLDNLPINKDFYNILAMDVQGYEGEVLKGAIRTLENIDLIYTEVNRGDTYKGNMLVEEMDEFLYDYQRVETYFPSPNWTWGDAVYIRKTLL